MLLKMSKHKETSFLLLFFLALGCSQVATESSAFDTLITEDYEVFFSDTLNTDQKTFVIAGLRLANEDSLIYEAETTTMLVRPLVILEKQTSGIFDIALRNDKVLLCPDCGGVMGEPLQGIDITERNFTINHSGGSRFRWTRNITFEYDLAAGEWYLFSDQGVSFDSLNPEEEYEQMLYTLIEEGEKILFENYNVDPN